MRPQASGKCGKNWKPLDAGNWRSWESHSKALPKGEPEVFHQLWVFRTTAP